MSMAQVKKQFDELTAYLGRDTAGLDKVRKLKEAVNGLRTSRAVAEEKAAAAQAAREQMHKKLVAAEQASADTTAELQRLKQLVANTTRELTELQDRLTQPDPVEPELTPVGAESEKATAHRKLVKSVLKTLRTQIKHCPRLYKGDEQKKATRSIDRDDLAKGWDRQSLWLLGASVAALASGLGQITVVARQTLHDLEPSGLADDDASLSRPFIQWIGKNNIYDSGPLVPGVENSLPKHPVSSRGIPG